MQKPKVTSTHVLRPRTRAVSSTIEIQKKTSTSGKRKVVQPKAMPSQASKRPRRKLILEKDDKETKSDEEVKKKVAIQSITPNVDEICHTIRNSVGLVGLKQLRFESMSIGDK